MLNLDLVRMLIADDPRPWRRLDDLDARFFVEIKMTDKRAVDELARRLHGLGLVVEVADGLAKSDGSLDSWVVLGHIADGMGIAGGGFSAIDRFLKTETGKRVRALLVGARGEKRLHPAFSFEALVAWCNKTLGEPTEAGPAWRFEPEAIKARPLPEGLVALEVYEEISGKVLRLVSDGEMIAWLDERVQSGPSA